MNMKLAPHLRGIVEAGRAPVYRTVTRALTLRQNMTRYERVLWSFLKRRGFFPQVPLYGFVADFYHPVHRLVIEVDGLYHAKHRAYDRHRSEVLRSHGNKVLRFSNDMIATDVRRVVGKVDGYVIRLMRTGKEAKR
jgi:very-short-patch-repair endonuclease